MCEGSARITLLHSPPRRSPVRRGAKRGQSAIDGRPSHVMVIRLTYL